MTTLAAIGYIAFVIVVSVVGAFLIGYFRYRRSDRDHEAWLAGRASVASAEPCIDVPATSFSSPEAEEAWRRSVLSSVQKPIVVTNEYRRLEPFGKEKNAHGEPIGWKWVEPKRPKIRITNQRIPSSDFVYWVLPPNGDYLPVWNPGREISEDEDTDLAWHSQWGVWMPVGTEPVKEAE